MPELQQTNDAEGGSELEEQLGWKRRLERERLALAAAGNAKKLPGPGAAPAVAAVAGRASSAAGRAGAAAQAAEGKAAAEGALGGLEEKAGELIEKRVVHALWAAMTTVVAALIIIPVQNIYFVAANLLGWKLPFVKVKLGKMHIYDILLLVAIDLLILFIILGALAQLAFLGCVVSPQCIGKMGYDVLKEIWDIAR